MASIYSVIENDYSEKRRIHTYGVVKTAEELASHYGADREKARTAALYHDLFRGVSIEIINYYVRQLGLEDKYLNNPNLAHSKIAAYVIKQEYGINDIDILNAVSYHTTGRENMSQLEKVIYLADAIEPNRVYPGVDKLRDIAKKDLDKACLLSLQNTIDFVSSKGDYLDPDTLLAKDYFIEKENKCGY